MYLAHVLCDPRTPATAVGSSSAAMQWSPARDEQRCAPGARPRLPRCWLLAGGSLLLLLKGEAQKRTRQEVLLAPAATPRSTSCGLFS